MVTHKSSLFFFIGVFVLLLLCPLVFMAVGEQTWDPVGGRVWDFVTYQLYLITQTGSVPYAILSSLIIVALVWLLLRCSFRQLILLGVIFACAIVIGQTIKSTIKNISQVPRPYVLWLEKNQYITAEAFYQKTRQERHDFIMKQDFSKQHIPVWLQQHWASETGYSFPSGHTIFVAQWVLMLLLLLYPRKKYLPIACFFLWAWAMQISRIMLGMHGLVDIVISCLLAAILSYMANLVWQRCAFKEIKIA